MTPITLIENKKYLKLDLQSMLGCHFEEIVGFCDKNRITKYDDLKETISFKFVGFLFTNNELVLFLPKYIENPTYINIGDYTRLLWKLLQKYQKSMIENKIDNEILDKEDERFHLLGTLSFLVQQYIEYDLYTEEHDIQDYNIQSEIDWQTTIDTGTAYLTSTNVPLYLDLLANQIEIDSKAKITDIHKFILNQCSVLINKWKLDSIFGWPQIYFETIYNWEDNVEEMLYIIHQSMNVEFQDQKLLLLKNLKLFIEQINSFNFTQQQQLIGTKYFHHIWEKCCADVLRHDIKIQNHITKPIWSIASKNFSSSKTLRPDFLKVHYCNKEKNLLIFDAKYYVIKYHGTHVKENPKIEDIVKQYMYHKALKPYMAAEGISKVSNSFLLPSLELTNRMEGIVHLDFVPDLPAINLIYLNANSLFVNYINNSHWNDENLCELLNEIKQYKSKHPLK